jgi:hypothetical protein
MNGGDLELIDQLCSREMAGPARRWIGPFREAFPDVAMEIVDLVAEGERVAGRFRCSGMVPPRSLHGHRRQRAGRRWRRGWRSARRVPKRLFGPVRRHHVGVQLKDELLGIEVTVSSEMRMPVERAVTISNR